MALEMIYYIEDNENIENACAVDLGCGTGMFISLLLRLGVNCIGVEIDEKIA